MNIKVSYENVNQIYFSRFYVKYLEFCKQGFGDIGVNNLAPKIKYLEAKLRLSVLLRLFLIRTTCKDESRSKS